MFKKNKSIRLHVVLMVAFAAFGGTAFTQQFNYSTADNWEQTPAIHTINPQFDSSAAIGILDEKKVEYKDEGKNVVVYSLHHAIIHIMGDKGIEMFNKVYIPLYEDAEVTDVKARTIMPDGKVINVDPSKIKDMEEDGTKYKIFAMDGVEKGSEVEYSYTVKRGFYLFGSEMFQSSRIPYQQETFLLVTPQRLRFSAKGFNGFNVSADTVINDQRIIAGYAENVPEMEDEKYSFGDKYLKRVDFKFSYNLSTTGEAVRQYTWKDFAKRAFAVYTDWTDKDLKAVDGFIKQIPIPADADEVKKIQVVEDYVKNNINVDKKVEGSDKDQLVGIIKTKAANESNIVKFFTAIFDKLGISYQVVFAEERTGISIDEDLENWNRAEAVLFYFPSSGKFITPVDNGTRYPYLPYNVIGTRGLFLKGTVIGNFKTAIGTFDSIPMEPFEGNAQNMEVSVKFDETLDTLLISSKQIIKGYAALEYRPIYVFAPKDKQDEITKDIIKNVGNSMNISNIKVENTKLTDYTDNKPLIISGDIKTTDLLENAGSKILFKVGELIGQQVEMYQEKPRQLPIEMPYPHVEDRKITIQIPDGYKVKNPNDLNIDITYKENGVVTLGFVSKYVQTGNTIEITINETYRDLLYPVSDFGIFTKVINASADFNKVVLVLEKAG
ncbi:MAG TPA: DUF3857 domain-containing protein [Chitinophagaceae bacterium]|nr:DUF3857 domain-containing protein [Chitinophagaceae bacterium]